MTTILADMSKRVMVADTMAAIGGARANITKVVAINGCLVGTAGAVEMCEEFCARFRRGASLDGIKGKDDDDEMQVLVMTLAGELFYYTGQHPLLIDDPIFGIGSGGAAAMAAWHAQVMVGLKPDPVIAVQAAAVVDVNSGGKVGEFYMPLGKPARRGRKA